MFYGGIFLFFVWLEDYSTRIIQLGLFIPEKFQQFLITYCRNNEEYVVICPCKIEFETLFSEKDQILIWC